MNLEAHPLAELIPAMTSAEYAELRDDIAANGLREEVTLYEGKILDGLHRARACAELGEPVRARDYLGSEPAAYVLSLNVKRRNLTPSQRAAIAVEFLPRLEDEARTRKAVAGASAAPGRPAERSAPRSQSFNEGHRAREEAGALVGVSGASVDRAKRVKREAPEAFEQVKAGKATVRTADREIRRNGKAKASDVELVGRRLQIAKRAKGRIETLVGTCQAIASATDGLKVEGAMQVSTAEEIEGWGRSVRDAQAALRRLRSRLGVTE